MLTFIATYYITRFRLCVDVSYLCLKYSENENKAIEQSLLQNEYFTLKFLNMSLVWNILCQVFWLQVAHVKTYLNVLKYEYC